VLYKKSEKTIFVPSEKKWQKVENEIVASFKNGHLEMTKDSQKKYEADLKAEKEAKEKAEKEAKSKK
jgi:phenolic acid decarboxylase